MGGGEALPESGEAGSIDAWLWKSFASCCSSENELDERDDGEKSSKDVRNDEVEVMRLMGNRPARCRARGPGSLWSVLNDVEESRPRLCTSDDDIEWSSSNSRLRAFGTRSSRRRSSFPPSVCVVSLTAAVLAVAEVVPFVGAAWFCRTDLVAVLPLATGSMMVGRMRLALVCQFHSSSLFVVVVCSIWFRFCMTARACSRCVLSANARRCFSASRCTRSASFFIFFASTGRAASRGEVSDSDRLSVLEDCVRLSECMLLELTMAISSTGGSVGCCDLSP
jgi:hypothetical protein